MPRYNKTKKFINASEYYAPLRKSRDLKRVQQYATPILYNPPPAIRARVKTTKHLWKYGDRFYNLAHQYYGDQRFWWVIAWWNGYPTEAHVKTGAIVYIPLNIESALKALRV